VPHPTTLPRAPSETRGRIKCGLDYFYSVRMQNIELATGDNFSGQHFIAQITRRLGSAEWKLCMKEFSWPKVVFLNGQNPRGGNG
jgi:hypothetical protein